MAFYVIMSVLFVGTRLVVGGPAWGIEFWLTVAVFTFIVWPVLRSLIADSILDPDEREFHRQFKRDDLPRLEAIARTFREQSTLPDSRFSVTRARRDRRLLRRRGLLGELERIEAACLERDRRDQARGSS